MKINIKQVGNAMNGHVHQEDEEKEGRKREGSKVIFFEDLIKMKILLNTFALFKTIIFHQIQLQQ